MLKSIVELVASRYGSKKGFLRYCLLHPSWRRYPWALRPGQSADIRRLVFICQGNICRSALATVLAEQLGIQAVSFGLDTRDGKEAAPAMIDAALAIGADLQPHRATRIDRYEPSPGDLVCLMEPAHHAAFLKHCKDSPTMTLLGLWCPAPSAYIHDPLCCGPDYFATCAKLIEACVKRIAVAANISVSGGSTNACELEAQPK